MDRAIGILGGGPISEFPVENCPTIRDVLRFYLQFWKVRGSESKREKNVAQALISFYNDRNTNTISLQGIKNKIRRLVARFKSIVKELSMPENGTTLFIERYFRSTLNSIFGITAAERCRPVPIDQPGTSSNLSNDIRDDEQVSHYEESGSEQNYYELDGNNPYYYYPPDPGDSEGELDPDYETPERQSIPNEILWKMFRTGVSFRTLSKILDLAFSTVGASNRFHTSVTHLFKKYQQINLKKEIAYLTSIRENNSFGSICFDHQKMRKIQGKYEGNVDRLAVVWHSDGKDNVLGISKMPNKKGESQTIAIENNCRNFGIDKDQVVGLICDNTGSNMGSHRGTCQRLEHSFEKPLLRLSCRHHIGEIVIKDIYHHLLKTDTPNNVFHSILKERWSSLRENGFPFTPLNESDVTENMNETQRNAFTEIKEKAINELNSHSENNFVRDDYKEITKVALKFLQGGTHTGKRNEVPFRALIDPSNARFMATCIQGLECYLFRNSLDWEKPELQKIRNNLKRFCLFVSLLYVRHWNRSTILFDAPLNDLNFLKEIKKYSLIDESVAVVAMAAMKRHLYYMGEELSPLSLFSNKVLTVDKNAMREKLNVLFEQVMPPRMNSNQNSNHISYLGKIDCSSNVLNTLNLVNLIGERSPYMFSIMNLGRNFLRLDADQWDNDSEYQAVKKTVNDAIVCVNDATERVISNCKRKYKSQRCRNENSFRQNITFTYFNS